jgi:hypothetical protein
LRLPFIFVYRVDNKKEIALLEDFLEDDFSTTIIVRGKATKSKILGIPIFDNDSFRAQVQKFMM